MLDAIVTFFEVVFLVWWIGVAIYVILEVISTIASESRRKKRRLEELEIKEDERWRES